MFGYNANVENQTFCDNIEPKTKDWAFWLRYFTSYAGYPMEIYEGFDFTKDYSMILGSLDSYALLFGAQRGPNPDYFKVDPLAPSPETPAFDSELEYTFGELVSKYEDNLYGGTVY